MTTGWVPSGYEPLRIVPGRYRGSCGLRLTARQCGVGWRRIRLSRPPGAKLAREDTPAPLFLYHNV